MNPWIHRVAHGPHNVSTVLRMQRAETVGSPRRDQHRGSNTRSILPGGETLARPPVPSAKQIFVLSGYVDGTDTSTAPSFFWMTFGAKKVCNGSIRGYNCDNVHCHPKEWTLCTSNHFRTNRVRILDSVITVGWDADRGGSLTQARLEWYMQFVCVLCSVQWDNVVVRVHSTGLHR